MRVRHIPAALLAAVLVLIATVGGAADDPHSMLDAGRYRGLVAENKASRIGDVLTVVVQEAASAISTVDLRAQRNFTLAAQADTSTSSPRTLSAGTDTQSDGIGRTQRTGRLLAQVSVRVTDIDANGDLIVSGQQSLQINGEEQLIVLSGVVRPYDIGYNNTVLSSRIADARIQFRGEGFVADQGKPGWLARILNWVGL